MTRIVLVTMFAMGLLLVPAFNSTGTVSAQKGVKQDQVSANEALDTIYWALDLRSATDLAVFAQNGVTNKATSKVTGKVLGLTRDNQDATTLKAQKDFSHSFGALNGLPCTEVADTELGGKTFGPGVYCLGSAQLAGEMVLDGQDNPNAIFIFRVKGELRTEKGSAISLMGDAQAHSIFFVADDSVVVGEGSSIKGSIFARNGIKVDTDATVDGRVLSLKGEIDNSGTLGPQQTGILEICKRIDTSLGSGQTGAGNFGLERRIFNFRVGGLVFGAPAGECSGPQTVPSGPIVIEELNSGTTFDGGTFTGNFELIAVRGLGQTPPSITGVNFAQRTANVTVREGGIANQTRIEFTNRFAITGIVEICKESLDSGVEGQIFRFTIDELPSPGAPSTAIDPATGLPFTQPVFRALAGQCTGPISVAVPADSTTFSPRRGVVNVRELAQTGFIFTGADTADGFSAPQERLIAVDVPNRRVTAFVVEGGVRDQTTIFFFNRSAAAELKVCKIAGPGIPIGQRFDFSVDGTAPLAPGPDGTVPQGGTAVTRAVSVTAGPESSGGFCQIVPGTFVVDSLATVTELDAAAGSGVGTIRVSRIRSTSGIVAPVVRAGGTPQGEPFFPPQSGSTGTGANTVTAGTISARRVTVPVRREVAEVEFVNFNFQPTTLKICKVAGAGIPSDLSSSFVFDVVSDRADGPTGPLFAASSSTVTVAAGPGAPNQQNGSCDFASGPFTASNLQGGPPNTTGSFDVGAGVVITERARTGFRVAAGGITSPTTQIIADIFNRSATVLGGFNGPGLVSGVNEVAFVNEVGTAQLPSKRKRARVTF
jgi:hypothetical protein